MLFGGLRRCEVLGLHLVDVRPGERRLFVAQGKGGHQRIIPVSTRFFTTLAAYPEAERPRPSATDRVFVCSRAGAEGSHSAPLGWMRSSPVHEHERVWSG